MTFKPGDIAICRGTAGYKFTSGKEYKILRYEPAEAEENGFIWPTYVQVEDDKGKIVACHADRFEKKGKN